MKNLSKKTTVLKKIESENVYEEPVEREDKSLKKIKIVCEEPIEQEYEPACEESNSKALVENAMNQLVKNLIQRL